MRPSEQAKNAAGRIATGELPVITGRAPSKQERDALKAANAATQQTPETETEEPAGNAGQPDAMRDNLVPVADIKELLMNMEANRKDQPFSPVRRDYFAAAALRGLIGHLSAAKRDWLALDNEQLGQLASAVWSIADAIDERDPADPRYSGEPEETP